MTRSVQSLTDETTTDSLASDAVRFHDRIAAEWEGRYKRRRFTERLRVLEELLPERETDRRWLDAGCGTGTIARWLARERGANVVAIDASTEMLANAEVFQGVTYLEGDIRHIDAPGEWFDGVVCSSVLEYLERPQSALRELARVLKRGGVLMASVPHADARIRIPMKALHWLTIPLKRYRLYEHLDYSAHAYTRTSLSDLLSGTGFVPLRIVDFATVSLPFGLRFLFPGALLMAKAVKT
jgi:2-polyprenyl-6-hydroxyphenyl methylase/3-demethylubiquinone-9 3-methyltransferase